MSNIPPRPGVKPPRPTAPASEQWYYSQAGQRQGPVAVEELTQLAALGQLQQADLVWRSGMDQWTEARNVKVIWSTPPPLPAAGPVIPPLPPSVSQESTAKVGLNRFIPDKYLEIASRQAVAIGITVAVSLLGLLIPVVWLLIPASAMLIYLDANSNKIGTVPPRKLFSANMSPLSWGILTLFVWVYGFPMYLIKRPHLIQKARVHPQEPSGTWWKAALLGVLSLGVIGQCFRYQEKAENSDGRAAITEQSLGEKLSFGADSLYYKAPVTEAEAKRLGQLLMEAKYFEGKGVAPQITKPDRDTYAFRIVAKHGLDRDEPFIASLRQFARFLQQNVFNDAEVDIHLCDNKYKTIRVVTPLGSERSLGEELSFGTHSLYYKAPVTEAEAKRLGQYLVKAKYFTDSGYAPQITKPDTGTYAFRIVAKEGIDRDEALIAELRQFARNLRRDVFPDSEVDIHLCDDKYKTIRVVVPLGSE